MNVDGLINILFSEYTLHLAILVGIYSILAQSFNLTIGLGRQFNLAHVAAYAIGAYTTALGSVDFGLGFFECLIGSALLSGLFAFLLGGIALRLAGDYFAIGTLAFSSIISALLINWKSLTRGVLGIPGIPRPQIGTRIFDDNSYFLLMVLLLAIGAQGIFYLLFVSPFARVLRAQAQNRLATMALGRDVRMANTVAFFISSFFAGVAGSLFAFYLNYIDPSSFAFSEMVFLLSIVVVGAPGSFWGCLGATVLLVLLPEPLRFIDMPSSVLGPLRQLLHSIVLVSVVWFNRARLFPAQREV
jgi:branched-chain amino acid transport system permease protein